ncbi:unnamed protein product [Protopolystoma xenopodis]|uniref:Uncharacterized protein n=1 Tax=Protopolystoma xenopodis TaxID=117903 RepID=A0A448WCH5_9PLAT|nr:unnamed protein product [Protopolystoma xenopodis]
MLSGSADAYYYGRTNSGDRAGGIHYTHQTSDSRRPRTSDGQRIPLVPSSSITGALWKAGG